MDYKLKLLDTQCAVIDGFCYFQIVLFSINRNKIIQP